MGLLRRLFNFNARDDDPGIYLYFKLDREGEIVRIRLNPSSDLVRDFQSGEKFVRKHIVGPYNYGRATAELYFNDRDKLIQWEIEGAELVTEEDYNAQEMAREEAPGSVRG